MTNCHSSEGAEDSRGEIVPSDFEWELCAREQSIEIADDLDAMICLYKCVVRKVIDVPYSRLVKKSSSLRKFSSPFHSEKLKSESSKAENSSEEDFEEKKVDEDDDDEVDDERGIERDLVQKRLRDMKALDEVIAHLNEMLLLWKS